MRVRSSELISSNESDFYDVNLYDSYVAETSEPSEEAGPRPYRYEPRRVQREDEQQQRQSLGRTPLIFFNIILGFLKRQISRWNIIEIFVIVHAASS